MSIKMIANTLDAITSQEQAETSTPEAIPYFFTAGCGAGFATGFGSSGFVSTFYSLPVDTAKKPSNPSPRIIADKLT